MFDSDRPGESGEPIGPLFVDLSALCPGELEALEGIPRSALADPQLRELVFRCSRFFQAGLLAAGVLGGQRPSQAGVAWDALKKYASARIETLSEGEETERNFLAALIGGWLGYLITLQVASTPQGKRGMRDLGRLAEMLEGNGGAR